ncbi:MAG: TM1812 family CRISPR-associated protein [Selenomonas sp.]|jgi:hypothetical protein|nr:TM1812 family CRISPR-associated protein [Selenomonas sp.]
MKHIMLVFVSDLKAEKAPVHYQIFDETIDCVQTNESAVIYMQKLLQQHNETLDTIFLILTNAVKEKKLSGTTVCLDEIINPVRYFEQRIVRVFPELAGHFQYMDYDEGQDLNEGILDVARAAEKIKAYYDVHAEEGVTLHADMTGGFRHASMMMLSIMQLLRYMTFDRQTGAEIKIDRVLYSRLLEDRINGQVDDATEIHRMFDLISGADEFVNFGSVDTIIHYFAQNTNVVRSVELRNLLEAMKDFSDAIKVCRTGEIREVLKNLNARITEFQQLKQKPMQEDLFSNITKTIEREYGGLIVSREASELDIIEWCVDREFLQQAMTLCNEWLPKYIVDHKICYTDDEQIKGMKDKLHTQWEQGFIIKYNSSQYKMENGNDLKEKILAVIDLAIDGKPTQEAIDGLGINLGKHFMYFINTFTCLDLLIRKMKKKMNRGCLPNLICIYPAEFFAEKKNQHLFKLLKLIYYRMAYEYTSDFTLFLGKKVTVDFIRKQMKGFSFEELIALLGIPKMEKQVVKSRDAETKWDVRKYQIQDMMSMGIMKTRYPMQMMAVMEQYYFIHEQRNQINHANEEEVLSTKKIHKMLKEYLELLRTFPTVSE